MPPKPGITGQSQIDTRTQYLGAGKELAEDELPTVRSCLRYCIYLRANNKEKELSATVMAKEVYSNLTQLFFKANAKLVPPVIMDEKSCCQKNCWILGGCEHCTQKAEGVQDHPEEN